MRYVTTVGETDFSVEVLEKGRVSVNGKIMEVDFENINGQPVYSMVIDGKSYEAYVYEGEEGWQVLLLVSSIRSKLRMSERSACVPRPVGQWLTQASSTSKLRCPA